MRNASNEVKATAASTAETVRARAGETAREAQARLVAEADRRREAAGQEAGRVAEAFRAGREKLDPESWEAQAFGYAAHAIDDLSHTIRDRSPGELVDAVSDLGRRNPTALIGGMALMGFALSRVATARRQPARVTADEPGGFAPYGASDVEPEPPMTRRTPMPGQAAGPAPGVAPAAVPGGLAASDPLSPSARPTGGAGDPERGV